jgi:hypothetical protein
MKTNFLIFCCIVFFSCANNEKKEIPAKETPVEVILEAVEIEDEEDKLIFTVQIAALKKANETLANLENINIFKEDSLLKYRVGAFETYKESRMKRAQLIKNYKGAFVQALLNDTPISITKALQY